MIRVAIHQPEFLGWLGFYHKMSRADVWVVLDDVQFIKRGFLQRNRIKTAHGVQWLTVPVLTKGAFTQRIRDVRIDEGRDWRRKHLATLRNAYAGAPFLGEFLSILEGAYAEPGDRLWELDVHVFRAVAARLGIAPRFVLASELGVQSEATDRLVDLTRAAGGDVYVSGQGGFRYMDVAAFERAGIALETTHPVDEPYPQLHGPFEPNLALFDSLVSIGLEETRRRVLHGSVHSIS